MAIGTYTDGNLTLSLTVSGAPNITTGSGAPGSTPSQEGDIYVDTTADVAYIAAGTASSADWKAAGASGMNALVDDTTPQLGGQLDINGNAIGDGTRELLTFTEDGSAVNHVDIENEATGSGPIISAAGDDANIDLNIVAKGTGDVKVGVFTFDGDQSVGAGQDNYVLTYDDGTGLISLEASAGGGGGLDNVVEDTTPQLGGDLDGQGNNLDDIGVIFLSEQAAADADVTGDGQIWVKTATPNVLMFTDDAGSDFTIQYQPSEGGFADGDKTKLDGIETSADVTDVTNVTAAGALMDSEVTNLAQVKAFDTTDYATAAQGSTADSALQNVVEDTTPQLGGNLDGQGNDLTSLGTVSMTEQAAANADVAGDGQVWVKNDVPNTLWFTDDAGTDFQLASLAGTETLTNKTLDGDNNTFSNLDLGNEVDWAAAADVSDAGAFASGDKMLIFEVGTGFRKIDYDDLPGAGGGLSNVVEDTTPQLGGDLDGQGNNLDNVGVIFLSEQAAADADVAGDGQLWIKSDTPNTFWFTDDAGTDFQVATLAGTETLTNKTIDLTNNTLAATSAELAAAVSDETGSGALVFGTSPTLVTPALGTPASGTLTNCDGTAASLTAGQATALETARTIGGVSFDGTANIVPNIVTDTTPQLGGDLDLNSNTVTIELVAASTVALGDVCYIDSSGEAEIVDADAASTCDGQLLMAAESITATNTGTFIVFGVVTGLTGLTAGNIHYCSLTGTTGNTTTTTKPSATGDIVRKVFTALTTTTCFFNPSPDYGEIP